MSGGAVQREIKNKTPAISLSKYSLEKISNKLPIITIPPIVLSTHPTTSQIAKNDESALFTEMIRSNQISFYEIIIFHVVKLV